MSDVKKEVKRKEPETVLETLQWVCNEVCMNMCKYHGTENRDGECQVVRENGSCPLSKLY